MQDVSCKAQALKEEYRGIRPVSKLERKVAICLDDQLCFETKVIKLKR